MIIHIIWQSRFTTASCHAITPHPSKTTKAVAFALDIPNIYIFLYTIRSFQPCVRIVQGSQSLSYLKHPLVAFSSTHMPCDPLLAYIVLARSHNSDLTLHIILNAD